MRENGAQPELQECIINNLSSWHDRTHKQKIQYRNENIIRAEYVQMTCDCDLFLRNNSLTVFVQMEH